MDETDELINSLGLLLTQTRFARRVLEDIERETANYATFTFTSVIAAGPRFGAPQLFDGALRVHVVNINDLATGSGFGGFISGLLGGAGALVGNLVGGLAGGTFSSLSIIEALPTIDRIAGRVARILELLGVGVPLDPEKKDSGQGTTFTTMLDSIKGALDSLTALFLTSAGETDKADATKQITHEQRDYWLGLLGATTTALTALGRVARGLSFALAFTIGSLSWLITRLGTLRVTIAETLQFALRNALLVRGAVLVTVFDTIAVIARLAASTLKIVETTVAKTLPVIFDTVKESLLAVLAIGATVGDAIKTTIDAVLNWLVPTIDTILMNVANSPAFRVLTHVVRILPAVLPAVVELKTGEPPANMAELRAAASLKLPGTVGPGSTTTTKDGPKGPPLAPDLAKILESYAPRLKQPVDRIEQVTSDGVRITADTIGEGLQTLATQMDKATSSELSESQKRLADNLKTVGEKSAELAKTLIVPAEMTPDAGLKAIADAYENWMAGGGLKTLLGTMTEHFKQEGKESPVLNKIAEMSAGTAPVTIQIDEVVIDIEPRPAQRTPLPAPSGELGMGVPTAPRECCDIESFARMMREYRMRGGTTELLLALG